MSAPGRVTVVGNGVAGFACARRLAEGGVPVTLIGPGFPCDRPPLSKRALVRGTAPYLATAEGLAEVGIHHLDGWAVGLDLARRRVEVRAAARAEVQEHTFEELVWATGLRLRRPPIAGIGAALQNADPAGLEELRELPGSAPFGPAERPMGGYLSLPADLDDAARTAWVDRARDHVATLPPKVKKPKK